jgi:hypothetical protein
LWQFHQLKILKPDTPLTSLGIIISKYTSFFKGDISIDKADCLTYRTIILQLPQTKRLISAVFFKKNLQMSRSLPAEISTAGRKSR